MTAFACPRCGNARLDVVARVMCHLIQDDDGNFETEDFGDHDWDYDSVMRCCTCDFVGTVEEFRT